MNNYESKPFAVTSQDADSQENDVVSRENSHKLTPEQFEQFKTDMETRFRRNAERATPEAQQSTTRFAGQAIKRVSSLKRVRQLKARHR
ncbi:hypothetical protein EON76_01730 [bacterium]|nr:MAG: hypothetical protein EON76_01730 [bacterium]